MISTVQDLAAEALFASYLQPSECPSRKTVEDTVTAMILRHGSDGCAATVASEFGDHPESAVRRMSWARRELADMMTTQRRRHLAAPRAS
jgi:nitrogenase molybdenum-iron protein alpha/beta subunit